MHLVNRDRLTEAERGAQRLLKIHPDAGMLWKILSVALVRQGKDALPSLRKTSELMPQDAEAHHNLGAALIERGDVASGLKSLHKALALAPQDLDCLVEAADATRALGRPADAVALYQKALLNDPRLIEAQNNLGNAYLELAQFADAAACYQNALQQRPGDAQILCNLSNAQRRLGRLEAALASSARAIAIEPGSSTAHNHHGLALAAMGRREEAAASFAQALALDPRCIDAINNLGNVLRDLGRRREVLALYARAVDIDPQRAEHHWNLGTILFELRRTDEAAASYRKALAIDPRHAPAHLSLGLALRQQRKAVDAEASCQAALALDPGYVEALSFLGELRADQGRFSEAEELFQRSIAITPEFAFGYFSIATHRKMTIHDEAWLRGAQTLVAKPLPLAHEISLRYALGKYFDDVKQYEQAFEHYRTANELTKRYGSTYDREKLTQTADRMIGSFHRASQAAEGSELPVLIVGMPRSGTSLAEQILASHPQVFGAGELPFWGTAYGEYRQADPADNPRVLRRLAQDYLAELSAVSAGERRVIDKMPANFLYAGLIHAAFPRARIIHMQRHPIDTCLSIYFQNFLSMGPYANDFENLAHYYGQYVRLMNHWRAVLPGSALLEVPYEGLVADHEGWTRRMLDFIGMPWDPRCLDFHKTERTVITASKWQVRQQISPASAGRWRNYEKFIGPLQHLTALNSGG